MLFLIMLLAFLDIVGSYAPEFVGPAPQEFKQIMMLFCQLESAQARNIIMPTIIGLEGPANTGKTLLTNLFATKFNLEVFWSTAFFYKDFSDTGAFLNKVMDSFIALQEKGGVGCDEEKALYGIQNIQVLDSVLDDEQKEFFAHLLDSLSSNGRWPLFLESRTSLQPYLRYVKNQYVLMRTEKPTQEVQKQLWHYYWQKAQLPYQESLDFNTMPSMNAKDILDSCQSIARLTFLKNCKKEVYKQLLVQEIKRYSDQHEKKISYYS